MLEGAIRLDDSSPSYPARLREQCLVKRYPNLWVVGEIRLLDRPLLGLVCSMKCPGQIILKTYDLARALCDAGVPVIGGFHSPMEKECLDLLLRGTQPVVICPARSLERMRVPPNWRARIDAERTLVISPFARPHRRATAVAAQERNRLVGALASEVVVLHADGGGRTEGLCRELVEGGTTVWTFDLPENVVALAAGARPTTSAELVDRWRSRRD